MGLFYLLIETMHLPQRDGLEPWPFLLMGSAYFIHKAHNSLEWLTAILLSTIFYLFKKESMELTYLITICMFIGNIMQVLLAKT